MNLRTLLAVSAALTVAAFTGCTLAPDAEPSSPDTAERLSPSDGHGTGEGIATGATEVAEPQLTLVAVDADGEASMLNLLDGTTAPLDPVASAATVVTDGRYLFASNDTGVSILDTGVWTWDHVDHFHYYRSDPRALGRVTGKGIATISTGLLSTAGTTGVFFPSSGEAVLLDNHALSDGEIVESLRLNVEPHNGVIAPLGDGAVVSEPASDARAMKLNALDAVGEIVGSIECPAASGTITTHIGVVVGCADGAVLASLEGNTPSLESIPYPAGSPAPAVSFDTRKGRPTVAGISADAGIWLLDTRERRWEWLETSTPVVAAVSVDDADSHVIAIGQDGTVQVYDADSGEQLAVTAPLLATTLATPALADHVSIMVDGQRAYVNAAADGVVYEIDYMDAARVARTLELPTKPVHLVETGR